MNEFYPLICDLLRLTFSRPRQAARQVITLGRALPCNLLWQFLLLEQVLGGIATAIMSEVILHVRANGQPRNLLDAPIISFFVQFSLMALMLWVIVKIGRWRGGRGGWSGALSVMIWLNVVTFGFELLQFATFLLLPVLSDTVMFFCLGMFFTLLSIFVAELHGFRSAFSVFVGIIATLFALALILTTVLVSFGIEIHV
jgi:hypothetical protein